MSYRHTGIHRARITAKGNRDAIWLEVDETDGSEGQETTIFLDFADAERLVGEIEAALARAAATHAAPGT